MHILFLHHNFPAQFGQIATHLARDCGYRCTCVSEKEIPNSVGIQHVQFRAESGALVSTHHCSRTFENQTWRSHAVYEALAKRPEIRPDLIVAHSGFVSPMFLRELYPDVPQIGYFEFFYHAHNSDIDFRKDLPSPPPQDFLRVRARNAQLLLDLHNCDAGYSPTEFQRSRFPIEFQPKICTIFDGIDTTFWRPMTETRLAREFGGVSIPEDHRVVTYVSRGLEAMRGFDIFLQVADRICRARRNVTVIVVGEDRVAYGGDTRFTKGKSFKEWSIDQHRPDLSRIHFIGRIPPGQLARLLSISDLHLYLTVPFVLSWSLMNALSCACKIVASDTPPVREMIRDGENGRLVDFFDVDGFVDRSLDVLDRPSDHEAMAASGRKLINTRYSIPVCLSQMQQLYLSVVEQNRGSGESSVLDESIPTPDVVPTAATETWPAKTLHVQLGQRWYALNYPFSPAMKQVLTAVFQGHEYPLCLPKGLPVETVVDIGGNVGAAAIWFHHHYPNARVISFEPAPSEVHFLRENTKAIDNIEVKDVGLSDRYGQAELHIGKYHAAQHSLMAHEETREQTETISLRSAAAEFATLNLSRISILKIDTEGCEVPILSDLESWFDRIDAIYVEYHCEADRRLIDQMLASKFYLVRAIVRRANLGTLVYLSQAVANGNREFVSPPLDRPGANERNRG